MKYYFEQHDSDFCYPREHFVELMIERGVTSIEVYRAVMVKGEEYFFCKEVGECGIKGESCGKQCESYIPRNGKNGRCRFSANTYEPSDESVILTINPKILKNVLIINPKILKNEKTVFSTEPDAAVPAGNSADGSR